MDPSKLVKGKKYLFKNKQVTREVTYLYETLNYREFLGEYPMSISEQAVLIYITEIDSE